MDPHLEPMDRSRLAGWLARTRAEYVADRIRSGDTPEAAEQNADRSYRTLFPDGVPAPLQLVFDVVVEDRSVGYVWVGPQSSGSPDDWWVWDIEINEDERRNGWGRRAMLLAEAEVQAHGGHTLGLNVFGFNSAARALYESLGYQTTAVKMRKTV